MGSRKRAVSPIIAVVMIIALTAATTGIIWITVTSLTDTSSNNLLLVSEGKFSDSDKDGKYDQFTAKVYNSGLNRMDLSTLLIVDRSSGDVYRWNFTTGISLSPAMSVDLVAKSEVVTNQINGAKSYKVAFEYSTDKVSGEQTYLESMYLAPSLYGSDPVTAKLTYKDTNSEYKSFKNSFPTDGYQPTLVFVLGKFSGTSIDGDYILQDTNSIKEGDYRPSYTDTYNFSQGIGSETNLKFTPYNDSGNYPGLIDYVNRFDTKDTLGWTPKGTAYVGAYIYNPESTAMDVDFYFQGDDYTKFYIEGVLSGSGNRWNTWNGPVAYTLNPGYTYILLKTTDRGGGFNSQILIRDTGTADNVSNLESHWIANSENNIKTGPSTGMAYRAASGPGTRFNNGWPGEGYSPTKFYLLGQFKNDKVKASDMYTDYIAAGSSYSETAYRPYNNSGDTFSGNKLDSSTNNTFITYKDGGNFPGLIDFRGRNFDTADKTLNWNDKGIVYVGFYINNPSSVNVSVNLHVQADDHFLLYFEGKLIEDHVSKGWNKWGQTNTVDLRPGNNYFLVKVGDGGGGWNVNILFRDPSGTVDVSSLINDFVSSPPALGVQEVRGDQRLVPTQTKSFSTQWELGSITISQQENQTLTLNVTDADDVPVSGATVELISDAGLWASSGSARTILTTDSEGQIHDVISFPFDYLYNNSDTIFILAHLSKENFSDMEDSTSFTLIRYPTLVEFSFLSIPQVVTKGETLSVGLQVLKDGLAEPGVKVRIEAVAGKFTSGNFSVSGTTNSEGIFRIVWISEDVQTFVVNTELSFFGFLEDPSYEGILEEVRVDFTLVTEGLTTSGIDADSGTVQQLGQVQISDTTDGNFPLLFAISVSVSLASGIMLGTVFGRKVGGK